MAQRNYKVVYKAKTLDSEEPDQLPISGRPRIPTALDPYNYPDDRAELRREVARARAAADYERGGYDDYEQNLPRRESKRDYRDDHSSAGALDIAGPKITKKTYPVARDRVTRDAYVSTKPATVVSQSGAASTPPHRKSVAVERDREESRMREPRPRYDFDPRMERGPPPIDYSIERPRFEGGAYIIETGRGDVDVVVGGDTDRGYGGYRNDRYADEYDGYARGPPPAPREKDYGRDDYEFERRTDLRTSNRPAVSGGPFDSGAMVIDEPAYPVQRERARDPYTDPRAPVRRNEEEDWRLVDSMRETRIHPAQPPSRGPYYDPAPPETQSRGGAQSYAPPPSEDDYVLVSPARQAARRQPSTKTFRSAMVKEDTYPAEERLRRRRSRSINFRDTDVTMHSVGERRHERPGAEAAMAGRYLRHYDAEEDASSYMDYERREVVRKDMAGDDRHARGYEDNRYPPQRDRSRRRRRDDDDESYYSEHVERKIKKETRYH